MPKPNKVAFVVPTKDRPEDLRIMLRSVQQQSRAVDQLIVVDGSDPPVKHVVDEFPTLKVDYVQVLPPSLARQRNAGMQRLRSDITIAGYLDDDLELEANAVEMMLRYWDSAGDDLGGTVFNITNSPSPRLVAVKRHFWLDSHRPGRVLSSGCVSVLGFQPQDIETDWLCGGATLWRREIINTYPYDEWYQGTGYLEDVDFSFRVRERYRLVLVSSARLAHYSRPVRPDRQYLLGKWQVVNRMYLVRKLRHRGLSRSKAWVASVAMTLLNLAQALATLNVQALNRARGNLSGMVSELLGRQEQIGGYLK